MPGEAGDVFVDNWAYLKAELNWLDRVLMMAIARQRKEGKEVDRIAQSRADRATSHWWKGLISLESNIAYDEHRKPAPPGGTTKQNYQQQLDARIQATHQQGIVLGLPSLCDRLGLTVFEKNLVLMSLAPEVNRRYARIYRYLQGDESVAKTDLPTVDLVLRLLCRNDQEWRSARSRLMSDSPLVQLNLLKILPRQEDTLLNYPLKLNDSLVDFLLAEQPSVEALANLVHPSTASVTAPPSFLTYTHSQVDWSTLVLPVPLLDALQFLGQSTQHQAKQGDLWGLEQADQSFGQIALLVGASGTGKTMAAEAIATSLQVSLATVDLAGIDPTDYPNVLQDIATQAPTVLLIKSAQVWLRRSAQLPDAAVHQFLAQRRRECGITLLSVPFQASVKLHWQRQIHPVLLFPNPDRNARLSLWKQALPPHLELAADIDWALLANQLKLTGGQIAAIAHTTVLFLATSGESILGMHHLLSALKKHGYSLKLQPKSFKSC